MPSPSRWRGASATLAAAAGLNSSQAVRSGTALNPAVSAGSAGSTMGTLEAGPHRDLSGSSVRGPRSAVRPDDGHHRAGEALVALRREAARVGEHHPSRFLAEAEDRPGADLDVEIRRG